MRGTLLGFVLTGRYYRHASVRPAALRLYATTKQQHQQLRLTVPTQLDMEDVGGLMASITLFAREGGDADDFAKGRTLFLHGDLGAGGWPQQKTASSRRRHPKRTLSSSPFRTTIPPDTVYYPPHRKNGIRQRILTSGNWKLRLARHFTDLFAFEHVRSCQ
jgi:hypothetical protein